MKQFFKKLLRGLWYLLWYFLAATIVLVAAVFGLLRLLLPLIGDYNQDVEQYAEAYAGRPIKIMSLDAEWHGLSPSLVLNNVRILNKEGDETILHISRARLDFDLIEIARTRQVQFRRFMLSGANLSLVRLSTGKFTLSGFEADGIEPVSQEDDGSGIIAWLLSQGEVSLHAQNFIFRDQLRNNRRYHYSDLSVRLRNSGDRHLMDGAVEFDRQSQQEFNFAADITGDVFTSRNWSGEIYVNGSNLEVGEIVDSLEFQGKKIQLGKSTFEIWSDWQQAELSGMQGSVSLGDLRLTIPRKSQTNREKSGDTSSKKSTVNASTVSSQILHYRQLDSRFDFEKYQDGWNVRLDKLQISNNGKTWPGAQFEIHYFTDSKNKKIINVQSSFIRIEDVAPLVWLLPQDESSYAEYYERYDPRGDLENLNAKWTESNNDFNLAARLAKVAIRQHGYMPGFDQLSGVLKLSNRTGSFSFETGRSALNLPKVFRSEIPVTDVAGTVEWEIGDSGISVSSRDMKVDTEHFRSEAILDIDIPASGKSPFLSIIARFNKGDASKASVYYPYSVMSGGALEWLDGAFVKGNVSDGGAIVYGPIDEFPFTRGQGVFDVRFTAHDLTLHYADGWPDLHSADARIIFRGSSLKVHSGQGKFFDSDVTGLTAVIPDFGADILKLDLNGNISGKTQNNLRYLLTAPELKARYERGISDIRTTGNSSLDLDITLSIGDEVDADVKGKLKIIDNEFELVQVPDLMDSINGEVSFDNAVIKGKGITANLLEQPVNVSVRTGKHGKNNVVEYKATGKFSARQIAKTQFPLFYDMVDGESKWTVRFQIPDNDDDPQLVVESSLKGVSLNLPVPFKKEKPDSRKLKVATTFRSASKAMMKITYAGNFEGILEKNYTREMWLTRGEVRFGGGPAVLPSAPGLRIAGDIDYMSYDVWENLIRQLVDLNSKEAPANARAVRPANQPDPYFTLVSSVDLDAKQFEIFGQQASNVKILMDNKENWLAFDVRSEKFTGKIKVPDDLEREPLVLDMEHLNITPVDESGGKIDPRDIPSVKLSSRSFNYGDKKLGQIAVETSKQANGMLVQQLIVKPRATTIKGHGAWFVNDESEKASLELVIDSKDLGKTMKDLGYVDTIANGIGKVNIVLNWPSSLLEPDLQQLGGQVTMHLENGRILDIEPGGAARLLGLFSLQTLPRRLMLDFSDLFAKGLKFDVIKGDFNIEQGDAYTRNLQLIGPNANVLLRGRIGLGAQDYDQKVKVTPHITDSTVLLSIITNQPLLFLFQQLLKQDIEAATSFEYTLSGKWDNYKLTPILKAPPPKIEQADDF